MTALPAIPRPTAPLEARTPYLVYLAGLRGAESARTLGGCLDRIARLCGADPDLERPGLTFPWQDLRFEHTSLIRSRMLQQDWSPAYLNKHLSALRGVLKTAWRLGLMNAEDYHRARDVENVGGSRLPAGRSLAAAELAGLLRTCVGDGTVAGTRDAALVALLYNTGLRRSEAAAALLEDYDPGSRTLRVIGKRDKQRAAPVSEPTAAYLGRWLALGNRRSGPLFTALHRSGGLLDRPRPLTPAAIGQILERRRISAGLPALTAHDFRRTFIGDLLDTGADLATVQALAGHASPVTTSRYDRRPERVKQEAVSRLTIPALDDLGRENPLP